MKRLWLGALLVLSGCSLLPDSRTPLIGVDWATRAEQLAEISAWEFSGRVGVKDLVAGDGTQANMRWIQEADSSAVRLSGPFGSGANELFLTPATLKVVDADGEHVIAYTGSDAAERFLEDQLGWSFPAQSTRYWLQGLSDPTAPAELKFDERGLLAQLDQYGWQISYQRYTTVDAGLPMPTRLVLEGERARLRIVISKWLIPANSQ